MRISARFLRAWATQPWVLPIAVAGLAVALLFSVLTRMDVSSDVRQVQDFGGGTVSVHLNASASTTDGQLDTEAFAQELQKLSTGPVCSEIRTYLENPKAPRTYQSFREFGPECDLSEWGYRVESGRWPETANEVVVTTATGNTGGDSIAGVTPEALEVVGVVANPYSLHATEVIAGAGTWESWGWPAPASRYPDLTGVVVLTTTADAAAVADLYATDGEVAVNSLDIAPKSVVDSRPYLYAWLAVPVLFLAAALALALHARVGMSRTRLLEDQGASYWRSVLSVRVPEGVALTLAGAVGVMGGWLLGFLMDAPVEWVTGSPASTNPAPLDPLVRAAVATGLAWVLLGVLPATFGRLRANRADRRSDTLRAPNSYPTLRWTFAIAAVAMGYIASWLLPDIQAVFFALLLLTVATGLIAPEVLLWVAARFEGTDSSGTRASRRFAMRRLQARPASAAVTFTAAAITIGPVVALAVLAWSSTAAENQSSRLPPAEGQALYYLTGEGDADDAVADLVASTEGDPSLIDVALVITEDGGGVVATASGTGAVSAVSDLDELELLLGAPLSEEAAKALSAGGVLWADGYSGEEVWTLALGDEAARAVPLPAAVTEQVDERWQRDSAGYMLTSGAEGAGLSSLDQQRVWVGLSSGAEDRIGDALQAAGYDRTLVRSFQPGDMYTVGSYQIGMLVILALFGVSMLISSTRSTGVVLAGQSSVLLVLGAPRTWLSRVFFYETGTALAAGALVGSILAFSLAAVALITHGIAPSIPWEVLLAYLVGLIVIYGVTLALTVSRLRRRMGN